MTFSLVGAAPRNRVVFLAIVTKSPQLGRLWRSLVAGFAGPRLGTGPECGGEFQRDAGSGKFDLALVTPQRDALLVVQQPHTLDRAPAILKPELDGVSEGRQGYQSSLATKSFSFRCRMSLATSKLIAFRQLGDSDLASANAFMTDSKSVVVQRLPGATGRTNIR